MFAEVETLRSRALTISGTGTAAVSPGGISSIVADISILTKVIPKIWQEVQIWKVILALQIFRNCYME